MPSLESLIDRLLDHGVEFVIVGGYAAVAHGSTLLTQDLDVCCRFDAINLMRIQKALSGLQPVHRLTMQRIPLRLTKASCAGLKNLYLDTSLGPLDCLGSITGLGEFDDVLQTSFTFDWNGRPCRILSIDALITAKKAMGRVKDLETVRQLQSVKKLGRERPC